MELMAGARTGSVGWSTGGGRSSWAAVGGWSSVSGPPVGGVDGWHRSMISGVACGADDSGVVACGGLWSVMGSGPGVLLFLANHGRGVWSGGSGLVPEW